MLALFVICILAFLGGLYMQRLEIKIEEIGTNLQQLKFKNNTHADALCNEEREEYGPVEKFNGEEKGEQGKLGKKVWSCKTRRTTRDSKIAVASCIRWKFRRRARHQVTAHSPHTFANFFSSN